jgi:hypothetical protein
MVIQALAALMGRVMPVVWVLVVGMAVAVAVLALLGLAEHQELQELELQRIYLALERYMQQVGLERLQVRRALQILETAAQGQLLHLLVVVMAVAVLSSSVIQTHSTLRQAQQDHRQLPSLVGSVSIVGRVQARSRFNHVCAGSSCYCCCWG